MFDHRRPFDTTAGARLHEFGIRMALGASAGAVRRLVFAHVGRITLVGSVIGVALALGLGRPGRSLLVGVESTDLPVLAGAVLFVTVVAFVAGAAPASRAAAVHPAEALRAE